MKNQTRIILIIILLLSSVIYASFGQSNITIFNSPVNLDVSLRTNEIATGYPLSIGASQLRECSADKVSTVNLTEIVNAVDAEMNHQNLPNGIPVLAAFFTTQFEEDTLIIDRSKTHGFCFGMHQENTLTLYYYEKSTNGAFALVENLTTRINSYSENLFIALHYSHFSPGTYPDKSTIFSFTCDTLGRVSYTDTSDLFVALSRDYKRQSGLYPLGMADSSILFSLESPNGGTSKCGNDCHMEVQNTHCLVVTDNWGTTTRNCVVGAGQCAAGAIDRTARDGNILLGVPIRFKLMRDFRDNFMALYCEGRKYTGFYYTFSKYAKMDISTIWKYVSVLPDLYQAMENLSDISADKIIVTHELKEKVMEILLEHENEGDSYFRSVLGEVAADMETYEGLKRSEVISMLTAYGHCGGGRQSLNEPSGVASYYAFVNYYSANGEMIVNYAVFGNRIKFELYNPSGVLVVQKGSTVLKQKMRISTSGLNSGVYVYRISSDSGYEKVGKVVVLTQ